MATLPDGALMQRAATGLAVACARRLGQVYGARVVLLVGAGNNGADALWAGAQLAARGAAVTAVPVGAPVADALAALRNAGGRVGDVSDLDEADLVVDGMVGIGGRGALRAEAAALAVEGEHVVAVDVPSGVDADTGAVHGPAVRAGLTVTFGTNKPGLHLGAGRAHAGTVELVDIGLSPYLPAPQVELLGDLDVALALPVPATTSDKFTRGVLGVAAGSEQYGGAAVLAVGAALRAGAGMVRYVGAERTADQVRARWPEAVVTTVRPGDSGQGDAVVGAGRVQAWVVGPGLGTNAAAAQVVEAILAQDVPVLVDADALTVCAEHPDWLRNRTAPTLLTPHDREFARFGRDVGEDRAGAARALAADLGVTVLLKGDATVIADAGGPVRVNTTGTALLATAGSGDVLAGAAAALLAQGLTPLVAGSVAAHLHGLAATASRAGSPTSASLLLEAWSEAVAAVRAGTLG